MPDAAKQLCRRTRLFRRALFTSLATGVTVTIIGPAFLSGIAVLACIVCLALLASSSRSFSGTAFSLWMAASVAAPLFYPELFRTWHGFDLKRTINPLIMLIMFGMGTTLSVGDFKRVLLMPRAVIIGMCLKYIMMPLTGKLVAVTIARGSSDLAAGVVLLGNVPSGVTSNVITYLAGLNVPLSVTMTALITIISPLVTPGLTWLLGAVYLEVDAAAMMMSMLTIVVVPVAFGLVVNKLIIAAGRARGHGALAVASTAIQRNLPRFVMLALCAALAVLTAAARDHLLYGAMLAVILSSVIVQTGLGLVLGYWGSRLLRLDETSCRTIAIEVGMQNSGVAAGLALEVLKKPLAAVPGVTCSIWQNIAGVLLASWWRKHPPTGPALTEEKPQFTSETPV